MNISQPLLGQRCFGRSVQTSFRNHRLLRARCQNDRFSSIIVSHHKSASLDSAMHDLNENWLLCTAKKLGSFAAPIACACLFILQPPCSALDLSVTKAEYVDLPDFSPLPTEFPPLPELSPPPFEQVTLPNGLRVVLVADNEVPLVRGVLAIKGGQRASPPDKVGVATVSAGVQRGGGSKQRPAEQTEEMLELLGASIEESATGDLVSVSFECLSEDLDVVLGMMSSIVTDPALPQEKILLYKAQVMDIISHRNDNPGSIPRREVAKLIYGQDSVFARNATASQVSAINRDDIITYLRKWERPDTAVLGLAGDFDPNYALEIIQKHLSDWEPAEPDSPPPPLPSTPLPSQLNSGKVFVVDVPGLTQSSVAMAEIGIDLQDPSLYPLSVLNSILNSFGGELFDTVRSREGLAYSVSGGWSNTPVDHPGLFVAGGETDRPAEFISAVRSVLQQVTQKPPTEAQLNRAKEQALNSFVFNFASTTSQMSRIVTYELLGLPQDFLFQFKRGIEAVTADDVLTAAQRHLHPDQHTVVVVTDSSKTEAQLRQLGNEILPLKLDMNT